MLKAVKMASVRGIVCVCECALGISLYSIVTNEAATESHVQVWISICFGAACKNYLYESLRGQIRGYRKEIGFFYTTHCWFPGGGVGAGVEGRRKLD